MIWSGVIRVRARRVEIQTEIGRFSHIDIAVLFPLAPVEGVDGAAFRLAEGFGVVHVEPGLSGHVHRPHGAVSRQLGHSVREAVAVPGPGLFKPLEESGGAEKDTRVGGVPGLQVLADGLNVAIDERHFCRVLDIE